MFWFPLDFHWGAGQTLNIETIYENNFSKNVYAAPSTVRMVDGASRKPFSQAYACACYFLSPQHVP